MNWYCGNKYTYLEAKTQFENVAESLKKAGFVDEEEQKKKEEAEQ